MKVQSFVCEFCKRPINKQNGVGVGISKPKNGIHAELLQKPLKKAKKHICAYCLEDLTLNVRMPNGKKEERKTKEQKTKTTIKEQGQQVKAQKAELECLGREKQEEKEKGVEIVNK